MNLIKQALLKYINCPECGNEMNLDKSESLKDGEILTGELICSSCSKICPVVRGVPRFVPREYYAGSFGFQWKRFNKTQLDLPEENGESYRTFVIKTGFSEKDLNGRLILDVGCGMGRYADVCRRWGAEVIGVDLSEAVDAAFSNVGRDPKVNIVQADLFSLPFRKETFHYIYSIGVLHHTPDTRKAFFELIPYLKKGGTIAIWVYSAEAFKSIKISRVYRKLTSRMPKLALFYLTWLAVPLYYLYRLNSYRFNQILPINMHPNAEWRHLDTFDWYSPTYQWWHTEDEVVGWFREAGLSKIQVRQEFPVSVSGVKG